MVRVMTLIMFPGLVGVVSGMTCGGIFLCMDLIGVGL